MRRWNLLSLVTLLVVAVLAAVLITPSGAMAAPSSSTSFKGKAAVYTHANTSPYFVVSFTCSPSAGTNTGTLTGGWTYEVNSTTSYSGMLASAPCALLLENGTWTTSSDGMTVGPFQVSLMYPGSGTVGTLTLFLSDIGSTKTYTTNVSCPTNQPSSTKCIVITATFTSTVNNTSVPAFTSGNYGTLNLTLP